MEVQNVMQGHSNIVCMLVRQLNREANIGPFIQKNYREINIKFSSIYCIYISKEGEGFLDFRINQTRSRYTNKAVTLIEHCNDSSGLESGEI